MKEIFKKIKTRARELRGLVESLNFFNFTHGYLLTKDHEETLTIEGKKITILPLWKWLLNS